MKGRSPRILVGLAIVVLLVEIAYVFKKGGIDFLTRKLTALVTSAPAKHEPSRYYYRKIEQYDRLPAIENAVVLVGDSLTEEGRFAELLGSEKILNRGISGDTTFGVHKRLDALIRLKPYKIFLMIGSNDIEMKFSDAEIIANYTSILEKLRQELPQTTVYVQSILPGSPDLAPQLDNRAVMRLNLQIRNLAERFSCTYIDLLPHLADASGNLEKSFTADGIHLTGEGYRKWSDQLSQYIDK